MALLLMFAFPVTQGAAETDFEIEQSKLNTEDAGPVEVGDFEISYVYGLSVANHAYDGSGGRQDRGRLREHAHEFGLGFGVMNRVELNFGIGYADLFDDENDPAHGHGWTDIEIGSKILLYENAEDEFAFSYAPSFVIPSGRKSEDGRYGPSDISSAFNQRLIASKNLGKWNVNMDSAYGFPIGYRNGARGTWDANLAFGYHVLRWFQPVMEFHYAHDFVNHGEDGDSFARSWGVIMPLCEYVRFDAGVKQVLAGRNTDQTTDLSLVLTVYA